MIICRQKTFEKMIKQIIAETISAQVQEANNSNNAYVDAIKRAGKFAIDENRAIQAARVLAGFTFYDGNINIEQIEKIAQEKGPIK